MDILSSSPSNWVHDMECEVPLFDLDSKLNVDATNSVKNVKRDPDVPFVESHEKLKSSENINELSSYGSFPNVFQDTL